jgi:small subunit ribosomal protein S16
VAVKIKLKRMGKIHAPYYRVVVADARAKRDGRAIEEIGKYHPKLEPSVIEIDSERAQYWLSVGAQPTDPVRVLLKITGDWQRFHGEDGAEGTLKTASPGPDKKEAFAAALRETHGESEGASTTPKGRGRRAEPKADKPEARSARAKTTPAGAAAEDAEAKPKKAAAKADTAEETAVGTAEVKAEGNAKAVAPDQAAEDAKADDAAAATDAPQVLPDATAAGADADADATANAGAAADEAGSGA